MQAGREDPADRWGDGGIQANQTGERGGGQSERRLEWRPRQAQEKRSEGGKATDVRLTQLPSGVQAAEKQQWNSAWCRSSVITFLRDLARGSLHPPRSYNVSTVAQEKRQRKGRKGETLQ